MVPVPVLDLDLCDILLKQIGCYAGYPASGLAGYSASRISGTSLQ
jgi:hypothetical protein